MTTSHSTNGLAKSWHQSLNTIILTVILGLGAWCWHLLTQNHDELIGVSLRQQGVLENIKELRLDVSSLKTGEVHQDDRLDSIEKKLNKQ